MTPFDDFVYLINHVLLGEEPTIEDFILLVGTLVAFIAFILWCCFPIHPKEAGQHRQFSCKILKSHIKAFDKPTNNEDTTANKSNSGFSSSNHSNTQYGLNNTSYSKNGTVPMHNYYVKSGHQCCT
ncbi:CG17163 [Drosophila busckii]|uniref:CG17163 n=2 Tax=Drosophila busckii TaxID=30019 RepID=A0A0M4FAY6_DROBS|nr:uncharacterized protein LOC108605908 isoform X2 [Drosophila busckii]ALC49670.1 CG17163 [Drosophila busckii]